MIIHTWQILLVSVAGWVNRELRDVVAYVMEENKIQKEQLNKAGFARNPSQPNARREPEVAHADNLG